MSKEMFLNVHPLPWRNHCGIVRADLAALKAIVGLSSSSLPPLRLQRRLVVLLSMMLCLWMFASATHFHVQAEDLNTHHTATDLCGFCASVPGAGAAPTVSIFARTADRQHVPAPAEILPAVPSLATISYRSRAPPAV